MPNPISRSLTYDDERQQQRVIGQEDIAAIADPVVILGDPGMGKSVLTRSLGERPDMTHCPAGRFVRTARPEALIAQGETIIVDGLDEIASSTPGGAVDTVLRQLSIMGNPPFVLTCREADWHGAADRIRIEDDYGAAPLLLHLLPFSYDDARLFLAREFPAVDSADILDHLHRRGLDALYGNPLTLRLLAEVVQRTGQLPERRADLLDRACTVMLPEDNPRHHDAPHVHRSHEELLLAAGSICATQVLCARTAVYIGPYASTPDDCVNVADVAQLPFGAAAEDALRTRLFQAGDERRFTHIHRVVAEYLGARWLAACFDAGGSARRIFSLFRPGDGVPTSLRGLHAWLAHFNAVLATRCIDTDPYAVLRYGDAETIGLDQARALLAALSALSETDPYFASDDWGRHPASGLMHSELRGEILAVIGTPGHHTHLTILLLNAMVGTDLAEALRETLANIMLDPARGYGERLEAADALQSAATATDWEAVIHRLLAEADDYSARLSVHILESVGPAALPLEASVAAILGHLGLAENRIPAPRTAVARHVPATLFLDLDTAPLSRLLDLLAAGARPFMERADSSGRRQITSLVRRLVLRVLQADPGTAPERLWTWLEWLDETRTFNEVEREQLTELLRREVALRAALLRHVLLTPCGDRTSRAAHQIYQTRLGLDPTAEDLVDLLHTLRVRAGDDPIDSDIWRALLRLGQTNDGMPNIVVSAAVETAHGDPELLGILHQMTEVVQPEWKVEDEHLDALEEARGQELFQSHRDHHMERVREIAEGNVHALTYAADVYLGRFIDFDDSASPVSRLQELLGAPLTDQALAGFVAVLDRDDLPSAADIAQIHTEQRYYFAEASMICGIAELLRRGQPIDTIDHQTLAAVHMAWEKAPESLDRDPIDIGPNLEAASFANENDIETHFRLSIEPQLACRIENIFGLDRLTRDIRFAPLACRLAVEWLTTFPDLPLPVATELVSCALANASREMLEQLLAVWETVDAPDGDSRLLRLSAGFIVAFGAYRDELEETAAADPDFIWPIRDRMGEEPHVDASQLAIPQLAFIVDAFGPHWPSTRPPVGGVWGNRHAWHATMFVERAIHEIAGRPAPEATEALQHLIDGPAETYAHTARHALSVQRKLRRDFEYTAPGVEELKAVLTDDLPETIDDMRAYFADRIEATRERMHRANTDMWAVYWMGDQPRNETFCRDRLVEQLSVHLPEAVRIEPEGHMPEQRRADFVVTRNAIGLPVEIKGQWHRDVWDAASDQLDAHYAREWRAQGRGVYIVLWFGDVPGHQLPRPPAPLHRPDTPQELQVMLIDRLPESRRMQIDVFVIDVTRPA